MCLTNRESMYQALKFELNVRHQSVLPIGDYLTFLHEMKFLTTTAADRPTRVTGDRAQLVQVYHPPCDIL